MRFYSFLWVAVTGPVCALAAGAAFMGIGPGVFVGVAATGVVLACVACALTHQSPAAEPVPPRSLATAAGLGALGTVVSAGLVWLLGAAGLGLVAILVAASPWFMAWCADRASPQAGFPIARVPVTYGNAQQDNEPEQLGGEARSSLESDLYSGVEPAHMTAEELRLAWRASFPLVDRAQCATERARLVDLRAGLLDELERRDPVGFARWMTKGARAASDPGRYITGESPGPGAISSA